LQATPEPTSLGTAAPTIAPEPTEPTQPPPTLPPTLDPDQCRRFMASSDFSRLGDSLDRDEYIRFLNRWNVQEFSSEFDELPSAMQLNYIALATLETPNGLEINIFGAKPGQSPTPDQDEFLNRICIDTAIALVATESPTMAPTITRRPTMAPVVTLQPVTAAPGTPTFPPGIAEAYNAFIISSNGLDASSLQAGTNNGRILDEAYELFVETTVPTISVSDSENAEEERRLFLRSRRQLDATYEDGTSEITLIVDADCPEGIAADGKTCQIAYAKFQLAVEENDDPNAISQFYTRETQKRIRNGDLQTRLLEINDRTVLTIEGSTEPVLPVDTDAPASASTGAPTAAPGGGPSTSRSGGGTNIGMIVGVTAAALIVIGVAYFLCRGRCRNGSAKMGNDGGTGRGDSKNEDDDDASDKDDDDDDDDEEDVEANGFGADASNPKKEQSFSKSNEDPKNRFGFGRGNKKNSAKGFDDDDVFGDNAPPPGGDGQDDASNVDFGDYAFEEPSIGQDRNEAKETGSVAGNDNVFGDDNKSAGWPNGEGAADNFFGNNDGGGWGVSNTQDAGADNFFGEAAFGESKSEASGSKSGSDDDDSYSSGNSTYESGTKDGDDKTNDSSSHSSEGSTTKRDSDSESSPSSLPSKLKERDDEMAAMIDDGNWDGLVEAAEKFNTSGSMEDTTSKKSDSYKSNSREDDGSRSSRSGGDEGSASFTEASSFRTVDRERQAEYRAQVEALVRLVVPDELGEIDAMMKKFRGREDELVSTLQNMQERVAPNRARAAIHKSKGRPTRAGGGFQSDGAFSAMSGITEATDDTMAGATAIAAASLPTHPEEEFEDDEEAYDDAMGFDDAAFGGTIEEGSYEDGSRSRSQGDEEDGSRSYYSDEDGSRSYYSDEDGSRSGSRSRSRRDDEDGSRSYYSDEDGSRSRSRSGRGDGEDGDGDGSRSYYSDEDGSRSRSYDDEDGSRSYYSDEDGSRSRSRRGEGDDGDGSRSYYSDEDGSRSRSQDGEERSYYSNEDEGSRSYYSDEEGSFIEEEVIDE